VFRIDKCDDGVKQITLIDFFVGEERLRDGRGIGHAGRLDHHALEFKFAFRATLVEAVQNANQIAAHGATNATVVHLDDLFFGVGQDVVINALFAEFVFDDGDFLTVVFFEDAVQERRFSCAEKAREDRHRNRRFSRLRPPTLSVFVSGFFRGVGFGGHLSYLSHMTENMSNFRPLIANAISPVFSSAQVRAIEDHHRGVDMMRRAGRAAFEFIRERTRIDAKIVLLVGPGNNGGDALACAAELAAVGYTPKIVMRGDPKKFGEDASAAYRRVQELNIGFLNNDPNELGDQCDFVVDGLFGIGLHRPIELGDSEWCQWTESKRVNGATVLALDVPSGIDADTGALVGDVAIRATHTLSFIALKPGLLTGPALDYVGESHVAPLGLDTSVVRSTMSAFNADNARDLMYARETRANAHKGTNGTLAIIGGASGMLGAALLASRAAMRMGAGKVKVGWLANPFPQVDPQMPEVMMRAASELINEECGAIVVGCGMGVSGEAVRTLTKALKLERPMVLDADALNLIAESAELAKLVQRRKSATIITPHPAEAARLLGASTASIQSDRLRAARDLAKGYGCIAALKGAGTVIDDGATTSINTTDNPLLATAGTGDVLAGMIGALLAQGYAPVEAARIGVALHAAAADEMKKRGINRAVASDVIEELRNL
jgi:ADP-dependent NAD(P)H-hydrate dehydratase / NAD(P)H-hydrate epimerase